MLLGVYEGVTIALRRTLGASLYVEKKIITHLLIQRINSRRDHQIVGKIIGLHLHSKEMLLS